MITGLAVAGASPAVADQTVLAHTRGQGGNASPATTASARPAAPLSNQNAQPGQSPRPARAPRTPSRADFTAIIRVRPNVVSDRLMRAVAACINADRRCT
ncbi:hypothetical protein [Peterkaempfera griseoplana]|uniref:hypothetical protein n=1 Tax=Peterkaempfera griseoplana TaxID=66896 RepID=UPI0006E2A698|nr:hypothetical protein [Peterkaempfera griseoplana]